MRDMYNELVEKRKVVPSGEQDVFYASEKVIGAVFVVDEKNISSFFQGDLIDDMCHTALEFFPKATIAETGRMYESFLSLIEIIQAKHESSFRRTEVLVRNRSVNEKTSAYTKLAKKVQGDILSVCGEMALIPLASMDSAIRFENLKHDMR